MIKFPDKKYKIIYADPPWTYRDKAADGKRGASFKYDLMTDHQILQMPVYQIADSDSMLFLWATMPRLQMALDTINSWGFEYKTCAFTWVKRNKRKYSWFWGMGNWTRSNAELCLLGVRGKPKRVSASVHSVIESPIERHSKKPNETRNRIVKLCGDVPRIELFARQSTEGWDVWGNEV